MAKRTKEYVNLEAFNKVGETLRVIKQDCDRAMSCDGDVKEVRDTLELIAIRAKVMLKDTVIVATTITPAEQRRLKRAKFQQTSMFDELYIDFERTVIGFGKTGDDRVERATFDVHGNKWYGSVRHTDEDGQEWHYATSSQYQKLTDVLDWLTVERDKAPTKLVNA